MVEFNDLAALERALAHGDVACVLAEPALTNIGIVLPEPGFHEALRELTREHGTLLIIDETHTHLRRAGRLHRAPAGWSPTCSRSASRSPAACRPARYGFTREVADAHRADTDEPTTTDVGGIGGTLAGNALSLAAMRATLEQVLTDEAFEHMIPLGRALGRRRRRRDRASTALPWHVTRLGCRAEYWFCPPPRNGGEAAARRRPRARRASCTCTRSTGRPADARSTTWR